MSLNNLKFEKDKFNFTKIKKDEILLEIPYEKSTITILINNSPLTRFHSLIVPDLAQCIPQKINEVSLRFTSQFMLNISDLSIRIGFNSPGALASVNHLHLHLIKLDQRIFIETINLDKISSNLEIFKSGDKNIKFICFKINQNNFDEIIRKMYCFIEWLNENSIPHNIHFLKDFENINYLKVFVFARKMATAIKTFGQPNLAFLELSGYVPVGNQTVFDELNEESLLSSYKDFSENIYENIYNFFEK